MQASSEPLGYYVKNYARYIIPTWLFPVYFIAFGLICEHFKIRPTAMLLLLAIFIAPVFFGTFFWSLVPKIPLWKRGFLTMVIPFLIFTFIAILYAIVAVATGVSHL